MMKQTIQEKITQRRLQILVHSCIYYVYDTSIISDAQWNSWANELVQLQRDYPQESKHAIKYDVFKDFDGSTGFDLPVNDTWIMGKARDLLEYKGDLKYTRNPRNAKENKYFMPDEKQKPKKTKETIKRRKLF